MINRTHKDSVFRDLFGAPERRANALELYNALNHTSYHDPAALELTTIDNVIYMGVKNDVSFLIGGEMSLWEHQSSYNPNMALRGLWYFGRLYTTYVKHHHQNPNGRRRIVLPTPRYFVFYNGLQDVADREVVRLSDLFEHGAGDVEVTATMLNINAGHNLELMEACTALAGYARLIELIRANLAAGMDPEDAVNAAVRQCIAEGALSDYLAERRAKEVTDMFLIAYDEEEAMELMREEAIEEGREAGLAAGREAGLAEGREAGLAEGREAGLAAGRAEGREAGLAEGREAGLAEGREAGLAAGRAEGRAEGRDEVLTSFLNRAVVTVQNGVLTVQEAAHSFGFTEDEILAQM